MKIHEFINLVILDNEPEKIILDFELIKQRQKIKEYLSKEIDKPLLPKSDVVYAEAAQ